VDLPIRSILVSSRPALGWMEMFSACRSAWAGGKMGPGKRAHHPIAVMCCSMYKGRRGHSITDHCTEADIPLDLFLPFYPRGVYTHVIRGDLNWAWRDSVLTIISGSLRSTFQRQQQHGVPS
jgi:hypothetical protein